MGRYRGQEIARARVKQAPSWSHGCSALASQQHETPREAVQQAEHELPDEFFGGHGSH